MATREHDPFFPGRGEREKSREAKAICARCPVIVECKEYVQENPADYGIWGGENIRSRKTGA